MAQTISARFGTYTIPVLSVAAATLLGATVVSLGGQTIFIGFAMAVLVSVWRAGRTAGFVSIGLSILTIDYFFLIPVYEFKMQRPADNLSLGVFILLTVAMVLLVDRGQRARTEAERPRQGRQGMGPKKVSASIGSGHQGGNRRRGQRAISRGTSSARARRSSGPLRTHHDRPAAATGPRAG